LASFGHRSIPSIQALKEELLDSFFDFFQEQLQTTE
jgi:hypothetical protein